MWRLKNISVMFAQIEKLEVTFMFNLCIRLVTAVRKYKRKGEETCTFHILKPPPQLKSQTMFLRCNGTMTLAVCIVNFWNSFILYSAVFCCCHVAPLQRKQSGCKINIKLCWFYIAFAKCDWSTSNTWLYIKAIIPPGNKWKIGEVGDISCTNLFTFKV